MISGIMTQETPVRTTVKQRTTHERAEIWNLSTKPPNANVLFYFLNTNIQSKMRISQLENFCLALLSKNLVCEQTEVKKPPPRYEL